MNKIQVLIDNGFIELNDVLLYAYNHNALEDLNNQEPEYDYDYTGYDQIREGDENYIVDLNKDEEQDAQELNDDYSYPEYVVASTSYKLVETMVFPSNSDGDITDFGDLACLALRYGNDDWEDAMAAVITLNTDEYKYIHVKTFVDRGNRYNLFKKINTLETTII